MWCVEETSEVTDETNGRKHYAGEISKVMLCYDEEIRELIN